MNPRYAIRLLPLLVVVGGLVVLFHIFPVAAQTSEPPDAPETVTFDTISRLYEPVEFDHEGHSTLPEKGCAGCHHHGAVEPQVPCAGCHRKIERLPEVTGGQYVPCVSCHPATPILEQPRNRTGLKRVYHVLCVGCHLREEAGPTECADCHTPLGS